MLAKTYLVTYTTEQIQQEIDRRRFVKLLRDDALVRKAFYRTLEHLNYHEHMVFDESVKSILSQARRNINYTNQTRVTIRQNGCGWPATYTLSEFSSNGKDNFKILHFFVEQIGLTNMDALKLLFNAKVFTKSNVVKLINKCQYRLTCNYAEEYLTKNLNPATNEQHFKWLEQFQDIDNYEYQLDCEKCETKL
jgi:hypothetical protein